MSTVKADTVQPKDFATDITLGASGDTVTVAADSISINKVQDKGGNTLWDYSTGVFVSANPVFASQSLKLLVTTAVTHPAGTTGVEFISGIDSTYDVYIFKFINMNPSTDNSKFQFNASIDGGSNYNVTKTSTFFDAEVNQSGGSGALYYKVNHDLAQSTSYQSLCYELGSGADESLSGELYLFNPSSTTYVKHFSGRCQGHYAGDAAQDLFMAGYINTTLAVNAIQFSMTSGNFDAIIKMYGIA